MDRLNLLSFVPFRLNRLAAEFSNALAADYARFGIDIPEWRVLATLGMHDEPKSASYIVRCTRTHKSRISRAVSRLMKLGFIERVDGNDGRREFMLKISSRGSEIYKELIPILRMREKILLSHLSDEQRNMLSELLMTLEDSLELVNCRQ